MTWIKKDVKHANRCTEENILYTIVDVIDSDFMEIKNLSIESIRKNDYNPNTMDQETFDFLVNEIQTKGFLQPILVKQGSTSTGDSLVDNTPVYDIIDGEHRWEAAKKAGLKEVPCIIVENQRDEAIINTITMNTTRGEMNPLLLAKNLHELSKRYDHESLAKKLNIKPPKIRDYLKLLHVDEGSRMSLESQLLHEQDKAPIIRSFVIDKEENKILQEAIDLTANEIWGKAIVEIAKTKIEQQRLEGKTLSRMSEEYVNK